MTAEAETATTTWRRRSRRFFLTWSGVAAGAAGLVATTDLGMPGTGAPATAAEVEGMKDADAVVWSACTVNCGSRCPLRLQVKDGTVVRVLPDNTGDDELGSQRVRACVRGRSIRHRIYNPDRLKHPLRRKAGTKRGDGQWEEISWDEALSDIATKMKDIKKRYGNEAFYINYGTGTLGSTMARSWPPDEQPFARMMNCWGGYLDHYSDYSTTEITAAYPYFYGEWTASNSLDDAKNAKMQVFFGNNPLETRMSGGGQTFITQQTRKSSGVRTVVIDPRYSETAALLADEWIAVRPGTDAALIAGMIHVMLEENLQDQEFLDRYCLGFDESHMPEGRRPTPPTAPTSRARARTAPRRLPSGPPTSAASPPTRSAASPARSQAPSPAPSTRDGVPSATRTARTRRARSSCSPASPATSASREAARAGARAPLPSGSRPPSTPGRITSSPTSSRCSPGLMPSTTARR